MFSADLQQPRNWECSQAIVDHQDCRDDTPKTYNSDVQALLQCIPAQINLSLTKNKIHIGKWDQTGKTAKHDVDLSIYLSIYLSTCPPYLHVCLFCLSTTCINCKRPPCELKGLICLSRGIFRTFTTYVRSYLHPLASQYSKKVITVRKGILGKTSCSVWRFCPAKWGDSAWGHLRMPK